MAWLIAWGEPRSSNVRSRRQHKGVGSAGGALPQPVQTFKIYYKTAGVPGRSCDEFDWAGLLRLPLPGSAALSPGAIARLLRRRTELREEEPPLGPRSLGQGRDPPYDNQRAHSRAHRVIPHCELYRHFWGWGGCWAPYFGASQNTGFGIAQDARRIRTGGVRYPEYCTPQHVPADMAEKTPSGPGKRVSDATKLSFAQFACRLFKSRGAPTPCCPGLPAAVRGAGCAERCATGGASRAPVSRHFP